jgi:hypothetical protein
MNCMAIDIKGKKKKQQGSNKKQIPTKVPFTYIQKYIKKKLIQNFVTTIQQVVRTSFTSRRPIINNCKLNQHMNFVQFIRIEPLM